MILLSEFTKHIKEDLVGALITLGENSLSDKDKIKETDKIIVELIKYIDDTLRK